MSKLVQLWLLAICVSSAAMAQSALPRITFSDLQSGPNTGGKGNLGAIVTVYGDGFGTTQGTSTVTVGGAKAAAYLQWTNTKISFQLGSSAVTGNIVVNAGGAASNGVVFTVRSGRIFFVSTTGADANSGSFSAPWATLGHARTVSQAGDIIYAMNGVAATGLDGSSASLAIAKSGSSGLPIAIVAYPGATVTIGSSSGQQYGIRTTAATSYWVLAGLTLRGAFSALNVNDASNWRIVGLDLSCPNGSGSGGCALFSTIHGLFMYGNRVHDSGSTTSTNLKLYQSVEVDTGSTGIDFGWNEIANTRACRALQFFSDTGTISNVKVHDNLIHDARCDGINLSSLDPAAGAVKAFNNVIYRVGTGPAPGGVEASYACINVKGTNSAAVQLQNNTLYDCGRRANGDSGAFAASAAVTLTDNIVTVTSGESYIAGNSSKSWFTGDHNLFFGQGSTPAFSALSVNADPKFVDATNSNFHLQSASPAIDKGSSTGNSRDREQVARPTGAAYDIGAYEYPGSASPPPPSPTPTPSPSPTPTPSPQGTLTVTPTAVAFGNVVIGSTGQQTVTVKNSSTTSVTISQVSVSGSAFSGVGINVPLTLATGQSATETLTFSPVASGTVSGSLAITSNATNASITVPLSGSGSTVQHSVDVNWGASTSTVAGYYVYRGTKSGGPYTKLNSTPVTALTYHDATVSSGTTYFYVITAVAQDGTESGFSPQATAVVPTP
jgi:hypothetical protein